MTKRFHICVTILLIVLVRIGVFAQKTTPILLNEPESWKYEKIDFPLDFAPDILYTGFEELRFAPGMFDTLSPNYFTYVFAISIDEEITLTKNEITDFLSKYYKGLCVAVANSKEMPVDTAEIRVTLERLQQKEPVNPIYKARINFFDAFTNGKEVLLNMELEIVIDRHSKKSYILALVSPQLKQSEVWRELYQIREEVRINPDEIRVSKRQ